MSISTQVQIPEMEQVQLFESFPKGIIALDMETTGLSPLFDKVIELGAIKITPAGVETFHQLIDPKIPIPPKVISIHGIRDENVRGKPTIDEILPSFLHFIGELPLLAHNAKFDLGFLILALHHFGHPLPMNPVYCSVKFSREVFSDQESYKLEELSKSLNIQLKNHHRAFDDALACLRLFTLGLLKMKKEAQPSFLGFKNSFLFYCSDFKANCFEDIPEHLNILRLKTQQQRIVEILYKGGSHRDCFRPVLPLSLLPMPNGHFLYAQCLLSQHQKFFSLKKISEVRLRQE